MTVDLKGFDTITEYLEATAEAYAAGSIDAAAVRVRCALAAEARQVVQDKARFGEALNKLKQMVKPQGLVKGDAGEPITGEPPMFKIPVLGSRPN